VIGAVLIVTALFASAVPKIRFEQDFEAFLPQDDPATIALHRAEERYGDQKLFMVAVETDDTIFKPETLRKLKEMEELFEQIPEVDEVRGPTNSQVIYGTETAITVATALPEIPQTPEELEAYKERVLGIGSCAAFVVSEDGKAAGILIRLKTGEEEDRGRRQQGLRDRRAVSRAGAHLRRWHAPIESVHCGRACAKTCRCSSP
jgi:predicted RND superfamily exporter protein